MSLIPVAILPSCQSLYKSAFVCISNEYSLVVKIRKHLRGITQPTIHSWTLHWQQPFGSRLALWPIVASRSFVLYKVPTQISNTLFSLFLPCPTANLLCQFTWFDTITYTKLTWQNFWENFAANFETSFTFKIREFTICANQIPCVFPVFWPNFQIPCVFPNREYFWPFSLFSSFSLCSGYPAYINVKPIFHQNANPFALGPCIKHDP